MLCFNCSRIQGFTKVEITTNEKSFSACKEQYPACIGEKMKCVKMQIF